MKVKKVQSARNITRIAYNAYRQVLAVVLCAGLVGGAGPALAAFPGGNGKIVFLALRVQSFGEGGTFVYYSIYKVNPDGSGQQRLVPEGNFVYSPTWSADGTKIAFVKDFAIYVMNADGTNQTPLTNVAEGTSSPSWSPDGTKIVFSKDRQGSSSSELYVVNANGTGLRRLTNNRGTSTLDGGSTWSPDGTKIAFYRYPTGTSKPRIYVINPNGSGLRLLTNTSTPFDDSAPNWSPDGTKLVFMRGAGFDSTVWVMNANGSNAKKLVNGASPAWSPDGTKIVYQSTFPAYELFTINPNGTGKTQIPNPIAGMPRGNLKVCKKMSLTGNHCGRDSLAASHQPPLQAIALNANGSGMMD